MCNGIDQLAGAVGKFLEVVPDLYDDTLKPAAKESGKALSRIPRIINAALAPLDIWILNKEYNIEETKKLLAKKLENVEPEKIVPPEPYVAVPALQAISYSMNSEELRNMYANLLANSMNSDLKDSVHPSFVEIIKQLSPFDATLLNLLSTNKDLSFPIIKIRYTLSESNSEGVDYKKHIVDPSLGITLDNTDKYAISIDNLIRLHLIEVSYEKRLVDTSKYANIETSNIVQIIKSSVKSPHYTYFKIMQGLLNISPLGNSFIENCVV
ncbi:DUF4393 domain-containing protein [Clostridium butyricum]|uniref:DUF4393 domain-containing protein n=1 Tax=Clostridium butyricum TaxID=1492 RepID=UPI00210797F1|nr:DUF4393 domain-containing protein [Clostridium butyricum]MCQ2026634.1 DUF4393 domain-containing protein [Clostridium butyricum]